MTTLHPIRDDNHGGEVFDVVDSDGATLGQICFLHFDKRVAWWEIVGDDSSGFSSVAQAIEAVTLRADIKPAESESAISTFLGSVWSAMDNLLHGAAGLIILSLDADPEWDVFAWFLVAAGALGVLLVLAATLDLAGAAVRSRSAATPDPSREDHHP